MRRCIGVDPDAFARDHWARRPLLTEAADLPSGFTDLISPDAVDELVSRRGVRTPFLRIAKDGAVVATSRFTSGGGAGAEIGDQVSDDRVLALFAQGSTLVLQALHRLWPPLVSFAAQLGADLGHPVQVNAYVTPPQSTGFSAHYDVHDVFVLQVSGAKRWNIHAPVLEHPLRDQPWTDRKAEVAAAAQATPVIDAVLRPGDALYLPRGWLHSAQALGDVSIHLTVGIHAVTRFMLLEALTALATEDAGLRASLPMGIDVADPGQVTGDLDATVESLVRWAGTADPVAVSERLRRRVWSAVRPAPVAPLRQAELAASLTLASTVRLRPHLRVLARDAGDDLVLVLTGRTITLPPAAGPAIKVVLSGAPFEVGELPGLAADEQLVLIRRLLREAVVVPADG